MEFKTWVPCLVPLDEYEDDMRACQLPKHHKHEHSAKPLPEVYQCEELVTINFVKSFRCTLPENHLGEHRFVVEIQNNFVIGI